MIYQFFDLLKNKQDEKYKNLFNNKENKNKINLDINDIKGSDDLYNITDKAAKLMLEKGLDPTGKYGCIGCGACTLEGDLYRYYKKKTIEEKL